MTIAKQRITCKCGEVFDADTVENAPIAVWIASMKAIRCPKCGSSKAFLGGEHKGAPPLSSSVAARAAWWIERGDVGCSSMAIYCAFTGDGDEDDCSYPLDPDDFQRCKRLLDLIPEWRKDLPTVAKRFPFFGPFVRRWDEMEKLYTKEVKTGTCPKLYDLMQVAVVEAEKL